MINSYLAGIISIFFTIVGVFLGISIQKIANKYQQQQKHSSFEINQKIQDPDQLLREIFKNK